VDDQPTKPLADDSAFLDSLGDLDQGLDDGAPKRRSAPRATVRQLTPKVSSATPRTSAPTTAPPPAAPPVVPRQPGGRRALLDLFPPTPGPKQSAPPASPRAAAAPAPRPPAQRPPASRRPSLSDALTPPVAAKPTYETFYGLSEPPFGAGSDPRFLYHSNAHDRVAQDFLSAIRRHDGVVIVTGDVGMGKTMLCRAVLDQLDRRTLTSFVLDPFASIEDILKTILVDFGVISRADLTGGRLANASRTELTTALREFLASLVALQAFAVVIIDDAHNLAADVLDQIRTISEAEAESRLLQIVLVGQPRLLQVLRRTNLRAFAQRAAVRSVLDPLDDEEVIGYVLHRLAVAGTNTRVEFEDPALARLAVLSGGVPRILNLLCDRALTLGYEGSASVIDRALIDRGAEDLDIAPPESQMRRLARATMTIAVLVVLMLAGAAAAALVFHDRLEQTLRRWEAQPSAPRPPLPRQTTPFTPPPTPTPAPDQPASLRK